MLDLRDSPWVDGPGRTVLDCAEMMDPSCCRIVVGAFDGGKPEGTAYEQEARSRGLVVERITERMSADPDVLRQVIRFAKKHNANLLHTHDFRSDLYGVAAKGILRIPMISTVHGWIENDLKGRIRTKLDKLILRSSSHVIAVSEQTRKCLGAWATEQRCTVIPNALRTERYFPRRCSAEFRTAYGIAADEVVIANIGRLSPEKGQMAFLIAARELLGRHHGLRFVLFGIGPDRAGLESFVCEFGMQKSVIFAGYRSDMESLYNELDLVVQSSFTEGMPNVIMEALLMEVPVIATDVGGTREVVRDGVTGVLIPPDDMAALVDALETFLTDRSAMQSQANKGRIDIRNRFDHTRRVDRLVNVYTQILVRHARID